MPTEGKEEKAVKAEVIKRPVEHVGDEIKKSAWSAIFGSIALIVLAIYTVGGMFVGKATAWEHISGFVGGMLMGFILI